MPKSKRLNNPVSPYLLRKIILQQSRRANVGHIGSSLSVADIIAALYGQVLKISHPDDPDRDRFILSKGHAALAIYAALFLKGYLTKKQLNTFCAEESSLGVHPEQVVKGIDFSTGSLGQGLSYAVGAALAARMQKSARRIFSLISDAECGEGSVWESAMFAGHHKLANLVVMIDYNKQQAFGYTKDILSLEALDKRWNSFGWDAQNVNGHNVKEMLSVFRKLNTVSGKPHVLIANTIFGKGVSYMENRIEWHYLPMNDKEYKKALQEIEDRK